MLANRKTRCDKLKASRLPDECELMRGGFIVHVFSLLESLSNGQKSGKLTLDEASSLVKGVNR
jgi:hypothetical protein